MVVCHIGVVKGLPNRAIDLFVGFAENSDEAGDAGTVELHPVQSNERLLAWAVFMPCDGEDRFTVVTFNCDGRIPECFLGHLSPLSFSRIARPASHRGRKLGAPISAVVARAYNIPLGRIDVF